MPLDTPIHDCEDLLIPITPETSLGVVPLRLIKNGEVNNTIQPKVLQVLYHLATNANQVVSHETLIKEVWQDNYFVGKRGIIRSINSLRETLGDNKKTPEIIISHYGKGYTLVTKAEAPSGAKKSTKPWLWAVASLAILVASLPLFSLKTESSSSQIQLGIPTPLIAGAHNMSHGSLSPKKNWLAYRETDDSGRSDIKLYDLEKNIAYNITEDFKYEGPAHWHPDEEFFVFNSQGKMSKDCKVMKYELSSRKLSEVIDCHGYGGTFVNTFSSTLSPDGETLLYHSSEKSEDGKERHGLFTYELKSNQLNMLFQNQGVSMDTMPAYSPSGVRFAYQVITPTYKKTIQIYDKGRHIKPEVLSFEHVAGLSWKDDNTLIFSASEKHQQFLYQYDLENEQLTKLNLQSGGHLKYPQVVGESLQYTSTKVNWRADGRSVLNNESKELPENVPSDAVYITRNSRGDLAYLVESMGAWLLYWYNAEFKTSIFIDETALSQPAWSRHEGKIVYVSLAENNEQVLKMYDLYLRQQSVVQLPENNLYQFDSVGWSRCSDTLFFTASSPDIDHVSIWELDLARNTLKNSNIGHASRAKETQDCTSYVYYDYLNMQIVKQQKNTSEKEVLFDGKEQYDWSSWDFKHDTLVTLQRVRDETFYFALYPDGAVKRRILPDIARTSSILTMADADHFYLATKVEKSRLYQVSNF